MNTPLKSGIYAIIDGDRLGLAARPDTRPPVQLLRRYAEAAAEAGAVAVQLRLKHVPPGHPLWLTTLNALRRALGGALPVVANDNTAAAVAAHVGLHLGQQDGDPQAARQQLAAGTLLGRSTHSIAQVLAAQSLSLDYLGFGPLRATATKADHAPPVGLLALAEAAAASALPVVAIGGLAGDDIAAVRAAGAHAMAVIGAWLGPPGDPHPPAVAGERLAQLVAAWRNHPGRLDL